MSRVHLDISSSTIQGKSIDNVRSDNVLDQSDEFDQLIMACRRGDLAECQRLISEGVNINGKDEFDYTPLIIASLCGHYELVELLLACGATAERNTYQGERCIHNALNDKIRNLLIMYDYSKETDHNHAWWSHIQDILVNQHISKITDIELLAGDGRSFRAHKFFLSLRSPYFSALLKNDPSVATHNLLDSISSDAVHHVLRYLYLWGVPTELVVPGGGSSEAEVATGIASLAKQLEVARVWDNICDRKKDPKTIRQQEQQEVATAQKEAEKFFDHHVLSCKMVVDAASVGDVKMTHSNPTFADVILRVDRKSHSHSVGASHEVQNTPSITSTAALYPCHKAILVRSLYFRQMFTSDFLESQQSEHLVTTTLEDCSPEALEVILRYMYTERLKCDMPSVALEVLYVAEYLMFDLLKGKAATAISNLARGDKKGITFQKPARKGDFDGSTTISNDTINIYDVIRAAWELKIPRLETFAGRYFAERLEHYIDDEEFAEVIRHSASLVQNREETDTIELLDDIRYFLSERFRMRFNEVGLRGIFERSMAAASEENKRNTNRGDGQEAEEEEENGILVGYKDENVAIEEGGDSAKTTDGHPTTKATEHLSVSMDDTQDLAGPSDGQDEDVFATAANDYHVLLQKIDDLLERLGLDA